jgi:hypothetical protein
MKTKNDRLFILFPPKIRVYYDYTGHSGVVLIPALIYLQKVKQPQTLSRYYVFFHIQYLIDNTLQEGGVINVLAAELREIIPAEIK